MERSSKRQKQTHLSAALRFREVDVRVQVCLRVICRKWKVTKVPYVLASLQEFVGPPPRTVIKANDVAMLRRAIALNRHEPGDSIANCLAFRRWEFNEGVKNAIIADNTGCHCCSPVTYATHYSRSSLSRFFFEPFLPVPVITRMRSISSFLSTLARATRLFNQHWNMVASKWPNGTIAAVNKMGRVSLLRRPVAVTTGDPEPKTFHGQVIGVEDGEVTVESDGTQIVAQVDAIKVVAPVVALLLQHVALDTSEWSSTDFDNMQAAILSRVLGGGNNEGSRSISCILSGLIDEQNHPEPSAICKWVDPHSGSETQFPLQHAVDYAFYIDGEAGGAPAALGESFCRAHDEYVVSTGTQEVQCQSANTESCELFNPFNDDDDGFPDASDPNARPVPATVQAAGSKRSQSLHGTSVEVAESPHQRRRTTEATDSLHKDALIVARLSHDSELLDRFLNLREQSRTQASSASADDEEQQPLPPLASPCKAKSTTKKYKYAFSPLRERQEVHDKLTSERHRGKDRDTYVHGQIRSGALLCKSLPGVLTRAYDYQFGSEGLSIMHFSFMDRKKRMEWIDSGSANFSNFSATADVEPAPAATSINDVVGAVRVFQVFAREYCVTSAIELVDAIIGFIEAKIIALP